MMQQAGWRNKLYYGDNPDILRRYVKDESVDLVYLDPPLTIRAYSLLRGKTLQEVGGRLCHD